MMLRNVVHKLTWRAEFLRHPEAFTAARLRDQCQSHAAGHVQLREDARTLGVLERLSFIFQTTSRRSLDDWLLLRRRRRTSDGSSYFDIAGRKLFYDSDRPTGAAVEGALTVLTEAFLRPSEFFSPEVSISPGDVVFDVGGHIGTSAMFFSEQTGPHGAVYSFEPLFHSLLRRNIDANGIRNVHVVPAGVSHDCGQRTFTLTKKGIDSRLASPSVCGDAVQADVLTLDAFAEREHLDRVDFVKMDIEGAEEPALRGSMRLIERFRPKWSIASYHTDRDGHKQHQRLVRTLRELGYRIREDEERHIYAW